MDKSATVKKLLFKAAGEDFERLKRLVVYLLDAKMIYEVPGLCAYELDGGITLEIYGTGAAHPMYLFENNDVCLAFRVHDLGKAMAHMQEEGAALLSGVVGVCDTLRYCYARLQNGMVVGLYEEGRSQTLDICQNIS